VPSCIAIGGCRDGLCGICSSSSSGWSCGGPAGLRASSSVAAAGMATRTPKQHHSPSPLSDHPCWPRGSRRGLTTASDRCTTLPARFSGRCNPTPFPRVRFSTGIYNLSPHGHDTSPMRRYKRGNTELGPPCGPRMKSGHCEQ